MTRPVRPATVIAGLLAAYWASREGRAFRVREAAEEADLADWLAGQPGVVISAHGGLMPEQWRGSVDGHSFYFRARHGHWRIELDLGPSGRFCHVWKGGALDDEPDMELKEGTSTARLALAGRRQRSGTRSSKAGSRRRMPTGVAGGPGVPGP